MSKLCRFTPTCVGTTRSHDGADVGVVVHPHVRGDNALVETRTTHKHRFTPTCVGTTLWMMCRRDILFGSPPRAWGQRGCAELCGTMRYGSPPRAWGQRRARLIRHCVIPVHPHVRGDNPVVFDCTSRACRFTPTCVGQRSGVLTNVGQQYGSPPRAWGQRSGPAVRELTGTVHPHVRGDNSLGCKPCSRRPRFTPTCVGTTNSDLSSSAASAGSPPRAWGQQCMRYYARGRSRFTPTCVGTTHDPANITDSPAGSPPRAWGQLPGRCPPRSTCPVHPHVRGDNGTNRRSTVNKQRFTPTCVGTTLLLYPFRRVFARIRPSKSTSILSVRPQVRKA